MGAHRRRESRLGLGLEWEETFVCIFGEAMSEKKKGRLVGA